MATFTLTSATYTVTLNLPAPGDDDMKIAKDLALIDLWVGELGVVDKGLIDEPLTINGIDRLTSEEASICLPICLPLCFHNPPAQKVIQIWYMQNHGEEVTVTGLGETLDGVYIVKKFDWKTIRKIPNAYAWSLDLEFKRS